jgi:hypothetical protein
MSLPELIGAAVGMLFTLLVFSYIVADNALFRFTIHVFIGVSAGFAGAVAVRNVILPRLVLPLIEMLVQGPSEENLLSLVPILLSILLLAKMSRRLSRLGNIAMAYLVGIGAAAAIGGSVLGTLFPQVNASLNLMDLSTLSTNDPLATVGSLVSRLIALVGTLATLIYFQFSGSNASNAPPSRPAYIEGVAKIGHGFIAITFGVMFAGVYAAAIAALIERVQSLWSFLTAFL